MVENPTLFVVYVLSRDLSINKVIKDPTVGGHREL